MVSLYFAFFGECSGNVEWFSWWNPSTKAARPRPWSHHESWGRLRVAAYSFHPGGGVPKPVAYICKSCKLLHFWICLVSFLTCKLAVANSWLYLMCHDFSALVPQNVCPLIPWRSVVNTLKRMWRKTKIELAMPMQSRLKLPSVHGWKIFEQTNQSSKLTKFWHLVCE